MKYVLLCISFLCWSYVQCRTVQEDFLAANSVYDQGKFEEAFQLYDGIEKKGPAVWYNMGNAAYHLQRTHDALVYWQRAARLGSGSIVHDALSNYAYARDEKMSFYYRLYIGILSVPLWIWQLLSILICGIFIILISFLALRSYAVYIALVMPGLLGLGACAVSFNFKKPLAIVQKEGVLYTGPDEGFHVVDSVSSGRPIRLLSNEEKGWYKGAYGKHIGWIKNDSITVV